MDAVITYVDGRDPQWLEDYRRYVNASVNEKRFRDWGTLKYLLRGIETNMPFIRNVYLLVARESQVPEWVDRNSLNIVLHSDIIPEGYLPTFNSNTIEMFLYRIPGLDEEFLYFNDDIFPVAASVPEDFFCGGLPVVSHSRCLLTLNLFKKMTRNTDRLARAVAGKGTSPFFIRPQHTVTSMMKSVWEELYSKAGDSILASLTPCRNERNLIMYIFSDYMFYQNKTVRRRISNKHFSLAATSEKKIVDFLSAPDRKFVCINDVNMSEDKFLRMRATIVKAFDSLLPVRSRFELG